MGFRLGINGYGRIGRCVVRAIVERELQDKLTIIAINEPADAATLAHLTQYDSTHGRFPAEVSLQNEQLTLGHQTIQLHHSDDHLVMPWPAHNLDCVVECSGSFSDRARAQAHVDAGGERLLFSHPANSDVDATLVYGHNHKKLDSQHQIVSAASCTTNCLIPVLDVLDQAFGIESGVTTTLHSAMNDQPVIDAYHHTDLRKTRAAFMSMIPVDTQLDKGIDRILPNLAGRFESLAIRVPTQNVSAIDVSLVVRKSVTTKDVNDCLAVAAEGHYKGILGYTEAPLASCDFNHDPRSGVVDASQTRVAGKRLIKLHLWFDNEWGYANRMVDVLLHWGRLLGKITSNF